MHLNHIKTIAKATFAFAIALSAMTTVTPEAHAQDLIARQAPVDRKMKAVDSVVINKAIKKQQTLQKQNNNLAEIDFENADLYSTWNTKAVHCYADQQTPEHYRIDLRGFAMPTPSRVITSNFGYRASFGRMHKGLDIKVYIGDTISSAFDGKVRIVNYEAKGYGNYVVIRHNNGLETIYGHLSKHLCKVGDVVRAGQPIGLGGNTGRSTGSHLHFETRIVGEAINPALLFDFVHQDVTGDFFEYRRNGKGSATARTQTASTATVRSTGTPKAAATSASKHTSKAATSSAPKAPATPKENTPASSPTKDATTAKASTKVKTKEATAKAEPTKASASKKSSSKASSSKAKDEKDEKASSSSSHSKSKGKVEVKEDTHHSSSSKGSKATAKASSSDSKSSHGHSHKA